MPDGPNLFSDASQLPYQTYGLALEYLWKEGTVQLPVAEAPASAPSNPNPCEIVRRHAPCGTLVVRFQVERTADWPVIPDPGPRSDNVVLESHRTWVTTPHLTTAGVEHVYAVAGEYRYFLKRPLWGPSVGLFAGWNPIDITPFFFLSAGQFKVLV